MEFMIDSINIENIKKYQEMLPLVGVTSNPTIIKQEGNIPFFEHMKKIRTIIGQQSSLHVQVVAQTAAGMIADAEAILQHIDQDVYIKIPVSPEGMKAIKYLKQQQINVTATGIYTKIQAFLALAAGADYVAPYFNRMENNNIDPVDAIAAIADFILNHQIHSKILAASFKNIGQVNAAITAGAQAVTVGCDVLEQMLTMPAIGQAVTGFTNDWQAIYGNITIAEL